MSSPGASRHDTALDAVTRSIGVQVEEILRRTDKSLVAAGSWRGLPVVVKLLLATDESRTGRGRHEIAVHQALTRLDPPFRVPRLLHTDGRAVLVLARLPGAPLDQARHPPHALDQAAVTAALRALGSLADWRGGPGWDRAFDHAERVGRYHAEGLLDDGDRQALTRLLARCSGAWELNHGDPLPSNLVYDGQECGLIDWEFAGLYPPGYDLALLRTVLARSPQAVAAVDRMVTERGIAIPFTVNLAMVSARELRLHRELPSGHPHRDRLPMLARAWEAARRRLRESARDA